MAKKKQGQKKRGMKKLGMKKDGLKKAGGKKQGGGKRQALKVFRKAIRKAMRKLDGRPSDMVWPALSPYLTVRDASASLKFYADAFGFKQEGELMKAADGSIQHAGMGLGGAKIMFAPQGMANDMKTPASSGAPDSLSLYTYVPDVDALAARAKAAGAQMLQAPADQFWGDRIAIFKDPDGYHWTFATNVAKFDASKAPK